MGGGTCHYPDVRPLAQAVVGDPEGTDVKQLLASAQESIGSLREQVTFEEASLALLYGKSPEPQCIRLQGLSIDPHLPPAHTQVAQLKAKTEAAQAAAMEAAASQEASAHDASTARGRAAAAETALETALATVQQLSAKHALASANKVIGCCSP